ncbi:MAG TPA: hypothetical protein DDW65_17560 [Firmicutes bacterium]|nr:hypothetical protein [Bacillota bacterium]
MKINKAFILGISIIFVIVILLVYFFYQKPQIPTVFIKADTENTKESVIAYLEKNVPEIDVFGREIKKTSNGEVKMIMRFDGVPDKNSNDQYHDYYIIYVGEDHPDLQLGGIHFM